MPQIISRPSSLEGSACPQADGGLDERVGDKAFHLLVLRAINYWLLEKVNGLASPRRILSVAQGIPVKVAAIAQSPAGSVRPAFR
jgi:hypothetical protein